MLKQRLLSLLLTLLCCSSLLSTYAVGTYLWPGKAHKVEVNVSAGESNPSWSTDNPTLKLEGSGFYRNITATAYFGGTATVTCTYTYRLGTQQYQRSQSWTFACNDTEVSISPTSVVLMPNETRQLSWSFNRTTYMNPIMQFTSGNNAVATVSSSGKITAKQAGTATIYVRSNIGTNNGICVVTVKSIEVQGVSLPVSATLTEGQSITLTPVLSPSNASTNFTWSTENSFIASVSSSGKVTGISAGTTVITVETANGKKASCSVTVKKTPSQPDGVFLPESLSIIEGYNYTLKPILSPEDAETTYTWASSNKKIAIVNSLGMLSAKGVGTCTVTVTTANKIFATCNITVTKSKTNIPPTIVKAKINRIDRIIQKTLNQK